MTGRKDDRNRIYKVENKEKLGNLDSEDSDKKI